MHPILSNLRKTLVYSIVCLVAGVFLAGVLVKLGLAAWSAALVFALPACLMYGFLATAAHFVCRALPHARRNFLPLLLQFGGTSLLSGLMWCLLCNVWNQFCSSAQIGWTGVAMTDMLQLLLFTLGSLFFLVSLLVYDALIVFEHMRSAQQRESESRVQAREAELQVLRTQINPHFLFNSLNSISALTAIDAAAAREMTISLASFFRQTLALSEREEISLADELALCQHFLAVEKIRFGKKLKVEMQLDTQAETAQLPPMILQPLLENAIKHGIRNLVDGGTIHVKTLARENWLHLSVSNPVDVESLAQPASGNGMGLKNLKMRFAALYGSQARVTWSANMAQQNFSVEMVLPLKYKEN